MPKLKQQPAILKTLQHEDGRSVQMRFVDLKQGFEPEFKQFLNNKCSTESFKRLSFSDCYFDLVTEAGIAEIASLINSTTAEVVGLNSNNLGNLSEENASHILNALTNPNIRGIELKNNKLENLIARHPQLFTKFLQSTSATSLDLEDNNISDMSASLLSKDSKFLSINLENNPVGDSSCKQFQSNPYIQNIALNLTYATIDTVKKLDAKTLENQNNRWQEHKFINGVTEVAKGYTEPNHNLNLLPREILMTIFNFFGRSLGIKGPITRVCELIITNIMQKNAGNKLWWKKEIKLSPNNSLTIFRTRTQFFQPEYYETEEIQATSSQKRIGMLN
ncbi:MAG: hypothetical protein H0U71_07475 [Gammaproteobacteria bacterium]|nr:hypothetical protein [Gammaproteobacteria bacterium]